MDFINILIDIYNKNFFLFIIKINLPSLMKETEQNPGLGWRGQFGSKR